MKALLLFSLVALCASQDIGSVFGGGGLGNIFNTFKPKYDCEKEGQDYLKQRKGGEPELFFVRVLGSPKRRLAV